MSFSFSRIILCEAEIEAFDQGKTLFEQETIMGRKVGTAAYRAEVVDSQSYSVLLGFHRIGSPKYSCTCEYFRKHFKPCAHIIASALVWDQERKVPPQSKEDFESIQKLYQR